MAAWLEPGKRRAGKPAGAIEQNTPALFNQRTTADSRKTPFSAAKAYRPSKKTFRTLHFDSEKLRKRKKFFLAFKNSGAKVAKTCENMSENQGVPGTAERGRFSELFQPEKIAAYLLKAPFQGFGAFRWPLISAAPTARLPTMARARTASPRPDGEGLPGGSVAASMVRLRTAPPASRTERAASR